MKVIWDIGANHGQNIQYYSMKADLVVAVEPNPSLANEIKNKYSDLISQGKLIVKNAAIVTASESVQESTMFFINRVSDVGSTLLSNATSNDYYPITVSTVTCSSLVHEYGHPFFVKIDIEGLDEDILSDMFRCKIFPKYLQAEFYPGSDVLSVMARHGGYSRFRFIDGPSVSRRYKKTSIKTVSNGNEYYRFAHGTAGPFGRDIHGTPMHKLVLRLILCLEGPGWKDVLAEIPSSNPNAELLFIPLNAFMLLRYVIGYFFRQLGRAINKVGYTLSCVC